MKSNISSWEPSRETCIDWTSLSYLLLTIIIYCVIDQQSITRSWRSFLKFKFSVFTFLRSMIGPAWWALSKIVWRENISTAIYVQCNNVSIKDLQSRVLVYIVWPALIFNLSNSKMKGMSLTVRHNKSCTKSCQWTDTLLYCCSEFALYHFCSWILSVAI